MKNFLVTVCEPQPGAQFAVTARFYVVPVAGAQDNFEALQLVAELVKPTMPNAKVTRAKELLEDECEACGTAHTSRKGCPKFEPFMHRGLRESFN